MKSTVESAKPRTPPPLRVLVCSGNMGNAEPDVKSLEAWIPRDGNFRAVVDQETQKYPVNLTGDNDNNNNNNNNQGTAIDGNNNECKFDLIVLGLQEATFEAREEYDDEKYQGACKKQVPAGEESEDDHDSGEKNSGRSATKASSDRSRFSSVPSLAKIVSQKVLKMSRKGVSTIDGVTASKDHTTGAQGIPLLDMGTASLHKLLENRLPSYKRLLSFQRGAMRILVYAITTDENETCSDTAIHSIRVRSVRAQNTGIGGLANKGGIVAEVIVNNTTTLTFVSCHLDAHEGVDKYKDRIQSIKEILGGTKQYAIPFIHPDVSVASHYCFFSGDLNFRTRRQFQDDDDDDDDDGRNSSSMEEFKNDDVLALIEQKNWKELNAMDELKIALEDGECLYGFQTLDCNFPPTFKVQRDNHNFVYNEKRIPSYTDRILWKNGNGLNSGITPLAYEPIPQFVSSDHKPIRGAFQVQLNQPYQLSAPAQHKFRKSFLHRWSHPNKAPVEPENLHLYLSDIEIDLFPSCCTGKDHTFSDHDEATEPQPPDTYLCLVTNPQELLLQPRSLWQQCIHAVKSSFCFWGADGYQNRKVKSWPRTPSQSKTYNPNWGKEYELHCKLQGFDPDDNFRHVQLGGSILYLFVFQDKGSKLIDEVLGYYPINLENLYRGCLQEGFIPNFEDDDDGKNPSYYYNFSGEATKSTIQVHETANPKMLSLDIVNVPLLKDGIQRGVLRCSLDAWWIKDSLAKAAKAEYMAKGLASNDTAEEEDDHDD